MVRTFRFGLRAKMIVLFLLFSGSVSVLITASFSEVLRTRLLEELKARLLSTVILGADSIDGSQLGRLAAWGRDAAPEQIAGLEDSADYRQVSAQLNKIRDTDPQVIRYVYTFAPGSADDQAFYVVDADVLSLVERRNRGEEVADEEISHLGGDFGLAEYAVARESLSAKKPGIDQEYVYDKEFRVNSISGYAPVFDSSGTLVAMLGIDMTDTDVRRSLEQITLLSGLITVVALLLSLILSFVIGALLTRNILALRKTVERFGDQDFTARSSIKARDEIGALGQSFNVMAQTIVDYQGTIARVEREKAEAELRTQVEAARNAENRKYLDNISQGLLLMDDNRIIGGQHSRFLGELFRLEGSPAGLDFLDFVFPEAEAREADRRELAEFLSLLKTNTNADQEMLDAVNPFKNRELTVHDGSTIVVDAHFLRVGQGQSDTIMVVFEDKTSLADAERQRADEKEKHDSELESIAAIVRHGPILFRDFLRDGETLTEEFSREAFETLSPDRVDHYFRQFHSLKGAARSLELHKIAEEAHRIEDQLAAGRDRLALEASAFLLRDQLASVKTVVARFQSFAGSGQPASPRQELDSFVASLGSMTSDLGEQLGKKVAFHSRLHVDSLPFLTELKNPILHLIRNSVDHGIEDLYERVAAGKGDTGQVSLEIRKEEGKVVVVVRDDGRGVDYPAIRRMAVKRGLLAEDAQASEPQLLKLLFQPRFSSRDQVTDVSGRGVGLDAVAQVVRHLKGKIRVRTKKGAGTAFQLSLPLKRAEDRVS